MNEATNAKTFSKFIQNRRTDIELLTNRFYLNFTKKYSTYFSSIQSWVSLFIPTLLLFCCSFYLYLLIFFVIFPYNIRKKIYKFDKFQIRSILCVNNFDWVSFARSIMYQVQSFYFSMLFGYIVRSQSKVFYPIVWYQVRWKRKYIRKNIFFNFSICFPNMIMD